MPAWVSLAVKRFKFFPSIPCASASAWLTVVTISPCYSESQSLSSPRRMATRSLALEAALQ